MNGQSEKYILAALGAPGGQNTSHQTKRHFMSRVTCPLVKHITPLRSLAFLRSCEEMELWESAASIPELLKGFCVRQKQPPPARARAPFESLQRRGWRARARARARALPLWKTFIRGRKVKGWGRGSEGREGTGSGQGSEGRGEGRGEGRESSSTPDQKYDFWACRLWASGS